MDGNLTAIMNSACSDYKEIAQPEIEKLTWIKYRIEFGKAFYAMTDETKKDE